MTVPELPAGSPLPDPVTMVVRRRVLPGHETAFEALVGEMTRLLSSWPGHLGTGVIRPAPGQDEYLIVVRWDNAAQAAAWETSPQRAAWLTRLAPHIAGEARIEAQPGLEFWFTPPASPSLRQPRRWKMTLVTLLALYPTSLLITSLLGPHLLGWPAPLRSLAQMCAVVPAMTYLIMPQVTGWLRGWLRP